MFFRALLTALFVAIPGRVLADYGLLNETVNAVGSPLPFLLPTGTCTGGNACGFVEIASGVVLRLRPLLTGVAVLVIVIFGYRMIVGQEDDSISKAKTIMSGTLAGLVLVYLIDPFIAAFYGETGEVARGGMAGGAAILTNEVAGLINWVMVIAASLSILMIILTGVKSLAKPTAEDSVTNMRKTILSVLAGLVLLAIHAIVSQGFVDTSAGPSLPFLQPALHIIAFIMSFLGLAALIVIVYAGLLCVLSIGKEEQYTKAKGILARAAIGALIVIVSWGLVTFIITPFIIE